MDHQYAQVMRLYADDYYEELRRRCMWPLLDLTDSKDDMVYLLERVRELKRQFWDNFDPIMATAKQAEKRAEWITVIFDRRLPYQDPHVLLRLRMDVRSLLGRMDEICQLRNEIFLVTDQPMSMREVLISRIGYICFGITMCCKLRDSELYQRLSAWVQAD